MREYPEEVFACLFKKHLTKWIQFSKILPFAKVAQAFVGVIFLSLSVEALPRRDGLHAKLLFVACSESPTARDSSVEHGAIQNDGRLPRCQITGGSIRCQKPP